MPGENSPGSTSHPESGILPSPGMPRRPPVDAVAPALDLPYAALGLPQAGGEEIEGLSRWVRRPPPRLRERLRVVVVARTPPRPVPDLALVEDHAGALADAYGPETASLLVRPDGHVGWRGRSWREDGLQAHLRRCFTGTSARGGIAEDLVRHHPVKTADRSARPRD